MRHFIFDLYLCTVISCVLAQNMIGTRGR